VFFFIYSYAQSWQQSLKRLQANVDGAGLPHAPTEISLVINPAAGAVKSESPGGNISPAANIADTRLSISDRDSAEESEALNLTKSSTTVAAGKGWSPPSPLGPAGELLSSNQIPTPKSPQGYRPASYNSSDLCVVCGDRASGNKDLG
jgi:hypothetical protein